MRGPGYRPAGPATSSNGSGWKARSRELFDVSVMPGVVCPMAIGATSPEIPSMITFDRDFAPLDPTAARAAA